MIPPEHAALNRLGTESWVPGGFHDRALMSVFELFLQDSEEATARAFSQVVSYINASAEPHYLLVHSHWMLENAPEAIDADGFVQFCKMPAKYIETTAKQRVRPVEYMRLIEEGMPVEYATEATRLT